ncbi:hypothetical protein ABID99_005482 [Mucilaginibacter sp. OAE612]
MPLQPHKATIVLPAFARSLPADGRGKRSRTVRIKRQEIKDAIMHNIMSLRAQRGNRTEAWPLCIVCDCLVAPGLIPLLLLAMTYCYQAQNKSASARQKSGPGSMACGEKHFFVLISWLLFHQGKSNWPPPGQEGDDVSYKPLKPFPNLNALPPMNY